MAGLAILGITGVNRTLQYEVKHYKTRDIEEIEK